MKKILAILTAILMMATFVACGNEDSTKETTEQTTVAETKAAPTEAPTEANVEIVGGDEGEGEKTLDSKLCTVTIPEGYKYEVYLF